MNDIMGGIAQSQLNHNILASHQAAQVSSKPVEEAAEIQS